MSYNEVILMNLLLITNQLQLNVWKFKNQLHRLWFVSFCFKFWMHGQVLTGSAVKTSFNTVLSLGCCELLSLELCMFCDDSVIIDREFTKKSIGIWWAINKISDSSLDEAQILSLFESRLFNWNNQIWFIPVLTHRLRFVSSAGSFQTDCRGL